MRINDLLIGDLPAGRASAAVSSKICQISKAGERAAPFTHLPEVAFGSRDVLATSRKNLFGPNFASPQISPTRRLPALRLLSGRLLRGTRMLYDRRRRLLRAVSAFASLGALALTPRPPKADAGGVGFWLPGGMGSLSAVPGKPAGVSPQSMFTSTQMPAATRSFRTASISPGCIRAPTPSASCRPIRLRRQCWAAN